MRPPDKPGLHDSRFRYLQKANTAGPYSEPSHCVLYVEIWLCFSKGGTKTVKKIFLETHYHLPSHINSLEENENRTFCPVFYRQQNNDTICRLQRPHQRVSGTSIFFFLFKTYLLSNFPVSWVCYKKAQKFGFRLKSQTQIIIYSRLPHKQTCMNEFKT